MEAGGGNHAKRDPRSAVGPVTILWATLLVALVVHEGSHYVRLRLAGLHPRPSIHFPGLGWKFPVGDTTPAQLRSIWLIGPLMESLTWAGAALIFPTYAWYLLLLMVVELITNLLMPGSDGRRALRAYQQERAGRRGAPPARLPLAGP